MDIARCFRYLHSRKPPIIHRDVKPANFLLDRAWKVKICDFGLSTARTTDAGTPQYMAPELLTNSCYNQKVDVYAFGIMLNEMISRRVPFEGMTVQQIRDAVPRGERPSIAHHCHRKLVEVIEKCWCAESSSRPSFQEVHELVKEVSKYL